MTGSKEAPDCTKAKITTVIAEVEKSLEILVLTSTSITKVFQKSHIWECLFDVLAGLSLQFKDKTSIMFQITRQETQGGALHFLVVVLVVQDDRMQCALLLVPVVALDLVLYHIMVVFCKVKQNEA